MSAVATLNGRLVNLCWCAAHRTSHAVLRDWGLLEHTYPRPPPTNAAPRAAQQVHAHTRASSARSSFRCSAQNARSTAPCTAPELAGDRSLLLRSSEPARDARNLRAQPVAPRQSIQHARGPVADVTRPSCMMSNPHRSPAARGAQRGLLRNAGPAGPPLEMIATRWSCVTPCNPAGDDAHPVTCSSARSGVVGSPSELRSPFGDNLYGIEGNVC